MTDGYYQVAFTPEVLDAQVRYGSRTALERLRLTHHGDVSPVLTADDRSDAEPIQPVGDPLTVDEREFLAALDGFYLATVSATGWPYVQFRGGPAGFIRSPDAHTIAWADFRGNRQYITNGHLSHDDRVALIFLDYSRRLRLKVYGHAQLVDVPSDTATTDDVGSLAVAGYRAKVEREVRVRVTAYDWNCQQHITPRYSADELAPILQDLQDQIAALQGQKADLQAKLDQATG
jgi:predicted pyridoxine 5'-phosphate oxidase superfamily flavin-nucleotide-binding protein